MLIYCWLLFRPKEFTYYHVIEKKSSSLSVTQSNKLVLSYKIISESSKHGELSASPVILFLIKN